MGDINPHRDLTYIQKKMIRALHDYPSFTRDDIIAAFYITPHRLGKILRYEE